MLVGVLVGAPKGNKYWQARGSHGPNPKFDNGDKLWEACCEYFQWVEDNPLTEMKLFHYQGSVTQEPVAKMRAATLQGLWLFLGIHPSTWYDWKKRKDLAEVVDMVECAIKDQKFAGAAADLLNANIIARDLGLSDKHAITQETRTVDITPSMSPEDAVKAYAEMMEGFSGADPV